MRTVVTIEGAAAAAAASAAAAAAAASGELMRKRVDSLLVNGEAGDGAVGAAGGRSQHLPAGKEKRVSTVSRAESHSGGAVQSMANAVGFPCSLVFLSRYNFYGSIKDIVSTPSPPSRTLKPVKFCRWFAGGRMMCFLKACDFQAAGMSGERSCRGRCRGSVSECQRSIPQPNGQLVSVAACVALPRLPYEGLFPEMLPLPHPPNWLLVSVDVLGHQDLRERRTHGREEGWMGAIRGVCVWVW